MGKVKICFACTGLGWYRGTQRMLRESVECFKEDCDVCVWGALGGETQLILESMGVPVFLGEHGVRQVVAWRPDVVNFHRPGWPNVEESRVIVEFHKIGAKIIETSVFGRVDEDAGSLIDLHLHISIWDLYRWNRRKSGSSAGVGVYCPYVVDVGSFKRVSEAKRVEWRRRHGIPDGAFVLGRLGKTAWEQIVTGVGALLDQHPDFYFASVDDYNSQMPKELSLRQHVVHVARLYTNDELSEFYSACDVCLNASGIGESFGMCIAESMACATPVVAFSRPDIDNAQMELIEHGQGGLLVADIPSFETAINRLIIDVSLRQRLSSNARRLIESRYSRGEVWPMMRKLFDLVRVSHSRADLVDRLKCAGFLFNVDADMMRARLKHVLGTYSLKIKIWTMINTSYWPHRLYSLYCKLRKRSVRWW